MPAPSILSQRLLLLQSFKETAWGTAGSSTAKWAAVKPYPEFKPYRKSTVFDEVRGSLAAGFNSAILRKGGEFKIDGHLTYEDANFLGQGFFGIVTLGSTTPFLATYNGPTGSQPSLQSYSFEYNQTGGFVQASGCIMNKLQLKGSAMDHWEYTVNGFAADMDASSGSAITSLADRTVEVALVGTSALCLDIVSGSMGLTAAPGVLIDFDLTMENGAKPIYTAGSLPPAVWVMGEKFKSQLTMSLLYTTAVRTFIVTTLMAGSKGFIQLKSTSGTKYITLQFCGVLSDEPALFGNKDGAQFVQIKLDAVYDATFAGYTNMLVAQTTGSTVP